MRWQRQESLIPEKLGARSESAENQQKHRVTESLVGTRGKHGRLVPMVPLAGRKEKNTRHRDGCVCGKNGRNVIYDSTNYGFAGMFSCLHSNRDPVECTD